MNPPLPLPLARSAWIRQEMASRVLTAVAACSVVVLALAPTVPAAPLRVCADPDNLPFTSSNPNERGLYRARRVDRRTHGHRDGASLLPGRRPPCAATDPARRTLRRILRVALHWRGAAREEHPADPSVSRGRLCAGGSQGLYVPQARGPQWSDRRRSACVDPPDAAFITRRDPHGDVPDR